MSELMPRISAEIAEDVYRVQDAFMLKGFMKRSEFSIKAEDKVQLKAEVGSRLINTLDGFGICAVGG